MSKFFTTFWVIILILPIAIYTQPEDYNLYSNWEFDEGETGWLFVVDASAEATHYLDEEDVLSGENSLRWEIVSGGDNYWNIQTYQNVPIELDVEYYIDLLVYYESDETALSVYIKWELGGDPYTQYHLKQFNLDAPYEIHRLQDSFISLNEDETANLKIFLGNPNADVYVWLDRLYVSDFPLDEVSGIEDDSPALEIPASFALHQNYPNPFNPSTQVSYSLNEQAQVTLQVFNQLGQLVNTLVQGTQPQGTYTVQWDGLDISGSDVASGVYIIRMQANGKNQVFTDFIKAIKIK